MTVLFALVVLAAVCSGAMAQELYKAPDPGIPELYTITGQYVRIAYNNEGYVSLGYRLANRSVDEEWMLLQFGVTVRDGVDNQKLKREALSIETPDGKTIPLATMKEYNGAPLRGLENQAKVVSDSINYFPGSAYQGCRIGFFARMESRLRAWDELELSSQRACVGRVFFKVPGGIQYGQHWLNVQFKDSLVKVPFRILTKEEQEKFKDSWQDVKKEHEKKFFKN
jgi:hypothetical protein